MKRKKRRPLQDIPLADYVVFCIKLLIIFSVVVLLLSIFNIAVPETLITCFFSAFGGEFLVCGLIKVFKIKKKDAEGIIPEGTVESVGLDCDDEKEVDEE